jgi:pyridoxal phosphate enzyme (YggS family)
MALALAGIEARIATAADLNSRTREEISLIVVSKNKPARVAKSLFDLGVRDFGENKDQEAKPKSLELLELTHQEAANWHFIGQLQSNKVKSMLSYAASLHSLDRESLLKELTKQLGTGGRTLDVFIELNLTQDEGRGGIEPKNLLSFAESVLEVSALKLKGVMSVAPLDVDANLAFEVTRLASEQLKTLDPEAKFISAGMSHDFEAAIAHGATHLRIGSAITRFAD